MKHFEQFQTELCLILSNVKQRISVIAEHFKLLHSQLSSSISTSTIVETLDTFKEFQIHNSSLNNVINNFQNDWSYLDNILKEFSDYIRSHLLHSSEHRKLIDQELTFEQVYQEEVIPCFSQTLTVTDTDHKINKQQPYSYVTSLVEENLNQTERDQLPKDNIEHKKDSFSPEPASKRNLCLIRERKETPRKRSHSFSYPPRCNNKSLIFDSLTVLNSYSPKRLFRSMLSLSSSYSTELLSALHSHKLLYRTSLLQFLTALELYTPAFLMHLKNKDLSLRYNLQPDTLKCGLKQLRKLLLFTPEHCLMWIQHVNQYLEGIDTHLCLKELVTRQLLNDLRSELVSLTRMKHLTEKKRVPDIEVNTIPIASSSSSSFSYSSMQTIIDEEEEVLQERIIHTKQKLKQTILTYKCIQDLLNNKSDSGLLATGDNDFGVDGSSTTWHCQDSVLKDIDNTGQSQTTLLYNYEDDMYNNDNYALEYALRLLHVRDTELLYIISIQNIQEIQSLYNMRYNLPSEPLTNEMLKSKLDKFMYWENIDPIDVNITPVHRIELTVPKSVTVSSHEFDPTLSTIKNQFCIDDTAQILTSQSFSHMSYYEDMDLYEQYLCTLIQNAVNGLSQLNQNLLESRKPILSDDRQDELSEILTRLLNVIRIENIQQQQHQISESNDGRISSSSFLCSSASTFPQLRRPQMSLMVTTVAPTTTTTTTTITTTTKNFSPHTATFSSFQKHISGASDSSNLSLLTNLTYPRRAEKAPINELVNSVDHLKNAHELRSLAKYLLDQYHIVTLELELQSDTNWCLRQRLTNANSQLDRLTSLLNKDSGTLCSIGDRLSLEVDKHSSLTEQYDMAHQKTHHVMHTLDKLNQRYTTSGRRLNIIPNSDEYLTKSGYSSSLQTMESKKSKLKSQSKLEVSSVRSRISDPDSFIINRVFIPAKIMQSISSQTEKHRKSSCLPHGSLNCGPILKRSSSSARTGRLHSCKRFQSSTPIIQKPSSSNFRQSNYLGINSQCEDADRTTLNYTKQSKNKHNSNWSELESAYSPVISDESDIPCEKHPLLQEYKYDENQTVITTTVQSENSTTRQSETSSSLSFTSIDSHCHSENIKHEQEQNRELWSRTADPLIIF
ncbi:unnamed protein product [Heterobilharzia americana]|nr:unnamed protein product [Heterobilharzia americana]